MWLQSKTTINVHKMSVHEGVKYKASKRNRHKTIRILFPTPKPFPFWSFHHAEPGIVKNQPIREKYLSFWPITMEENVIYGDQWGRKVWETYHSRFKDYDLKQDVAGIVMTLLRCLKKIMFYSRPSKENKFITFLDCLPLHHWSLNLK